MAIREGVLKNIQITAEHFAALYNNLPFEHFVYDAKKVNRLRQFATSTTLQILVINIDAFRKNFTGTASGGTTTLFSNGFEASTGWAQVDTSGTAGTWSLVMIPYHQVPGAPMGKTTLRICQDPPLSSHRPVVPKSPTISWLPLPSTSAAATPSGLTPLSWSQVPLP